MDSLKTVLSIVLVLFVSSAVMTGQPLRSNLTGPVTTIPSESREKELERHRTQLERAKAGHIQVAFIGDSITAGWETHGKEIWSRDYLPLKAANFGINGDGTQHVLWRIDEGILQGYEARLIVLAIGTNNHTRPTAEIVAGVEAIIEQIRIQQPQARILLTSVMPRGNSIRAGEPEAFDRKFTALNREYAALADNRLIFFLDTFAHMQGPDRGYKPAYTRDRIHLLAAGYEAWAEKLTPEIGRILALPPVSR